VVVPSPVGIALQWITGCGGLALCIAGSPPAALARPWFPFQDLQSWRIDDLYFARCAPRESSTWL
jgi:hypothetical protein